jgi:hypothetical protein
MKNASAVTGFQAVGRRKKTVSTAATSSALFVRDPERETGQAIMKYLII